MIKKLFFIFGSLLLTALRIAAQNGSSNLEFVENKGQWDKRVLFRGELGNGAFFLQKQGFTVLVHNPDELARLISNHHGHMQAMSLQQKNNPAAADRKIMPVAGNQMLHSHAYSVSFKNGNDADQVTIIPDKPLPGYNNYFIGHDRSQWASNCKVYQGITYKNVYPNIDIRYYSNNGRLKYDIIVHPGGDVNKIALKYEGVDKMNIRNNRLQVKTSAGDVEEMEPYSYQFDTAGKTEINCKYNIDTDNTIRFKIKKYSPNTTLIIDPSIVFCSFTGSSVSNWGFTATPGPDGGFYAGGIVFGQGFPVSTGAHQENFSGGTFDVGIMKFNSTGSTRVYATYIGGKANEAPHSLFCDRQGNLVVLGRTYSDSSFPYIRKIGPGGGADMFVVKLNATGSGLIGSLLIGGRGSDCVNMEDQLAGGSGVEKANSLIRNYGDDSRSEVVLDAANNIYIAASVQDSFPIVGRVFQPAFGGGKQDGIVLKIDPACSNILFSSFLGGSKEDGAFVLKLNPLNSDIYVAGATASNADFPGNKTGVFQPTFQGDTCDGFVAIISNDGSTLKKSSYFGTPGVDVIYGIEFDKKGFPYIMGTTHGNWPVTITPSTGFINPGAKQFVSKLQPDLSGLVYSTTFGTAGRLPNISPVAFLVDRCENVYISGWGGWIFASQDPYGLAGTFGMPTTSDAIKRGTDGRDFYFIVIKKDAASQLYGTFFGQTEGQGSISEHVDGGTSRYDQNGVIYQAICANCGGNSVGPYPTTPGVWARLNGAGTTGCNLAAVKIAFNFSGVTAGVKSMINGRYDSSGCVPLTVVFTDTIRNAKSYIWNFGDGSPDSATTAYQISHTYNNIGTYRVRLIAIDSSSCNVSDTVYLNIRARNDEAHLDMKITKLTPCNALNFQFENFSTPPAGKPFTDTSFVWDFGDGSSRIFAGTNTLTHAYASPGTYIVKLVLVDTNYCNKLDSLTDTLRVAALVKAQFQTPAAGCAPYTAVFNNTSAAGQQFFWDFGDGSASNQFSPTHLYNDIGTYTIRLTVIDSGTCNIIDSTRFTITVSPKPIAGFTHAPVPPVENTPTVFTNTSTGATRFKWLFGDGDSTIKNSPDTVKHQYQRPGIFQACLIAYNQYDCTDTVCQPVEALINPLLDVPNAFTPGRFGQNSVIKVVGFGIATMTFRIYNRWGQKVFESNNPNLGWDGTFKGVPQPMDVYVYTLDAIYFYGSKTTRRGDITLIR